MDTHIHPDDAALDALGVVEKIRRAAVFIDRMVMMDAVDCSELASVPTGEEFRSRFGNPYVVTQRADLHGALYAAVHSNPLVRLHINARVASLDHFEDGAAVTLADGRRWSAMPRIR